MSSQRLRAGSDAPTDRRPLVAGLSVFIPIAILGNALGPVLRYPDVGSAILFVPYAALTAVLAVSRPRQWIWYILVDFVAHFATHWPIWPVSWVLMAGAANLTRALVAAGLLSRFFHEPPRLDGIRSLIVFVTSAVFMAPAVGATIGAATVVLHGGSSTYWLPWTAWFVSNALTGLAMLPALIVGFAHVMGAYRFDLTRERVLEVVALAFALGATSAFAFLTEPSRHHLALPLYAPLPVMVWAALRFGAGGASAVLTVVTFAAIWSVDRGTGPFTGVAPDANILTLQIFVLFTSVPVLCLAAVATARQSVVQLHNALLASFQDQVAILDADGTVIEVNESWLRFAAAPFALEFNRVRAGDRYLAGCEASAAHGDATAAGVLEGLRAVLGGSRRHFAIEYDVERQGQRRTFTMNVEALERVGGGAVLRRSDVTARRQAQLEIEEQRRQLSHLARVAVLGHLSGAFAHELNQPLSAILSNAETAREVLRRQPGNVEYLKAILRDIIADDERAAAVVQRLRALLKRGDRRLQLIEPRELVNEVLDLARTDLITRHVEATAVVSPELPPLWGDKVQLQQVLLNLILNGCEAMSTTAASARRLVLTAEPGGMGSIHLAVRDCGVGIPPALIDRLFEPFVTTKADGLGLGLSISRTIVAAHGGRLWGENNADCGATLHCQLPVAQTSRSATGLEASDVPVAAGDPR